jgi:type II secretory pathway component PulF
VAIFLRHQGQLILGAKMEFRYEGFLKSGVPKRGLIDAGNLGEASAKLREMGVFVNSLEPNGPGEMKTVLAHISPEEPKIDMREQLQKDWVPEKSVNNWVAELHANMQAIQLVEAEWKKSFEGAADEGFRLARNEAVRQAVLRAIKSAS